MWFSLSFFLFLEYWTFSGAPAQNARSTSLGSLEYPSGISPPAPNLPTVQSSSTHPPRSLLRKSRYETIDTLRGELQAIRDGIARILTNLQTLNDTLSVQQPTAQDAQHHNVSSTRRRMDEMDTSPIDSVADDQNGTAMTGNAFDHAIQENNTQSSGSGFPDEGMQQVHYCRGCQPCVSTNLYLLAGTQRPPTDPMSSQYDNANPAIPNYSFPQPPNTFGPPVPFVGPWQGFPIGPPMVPVPHPGAPQVSNAAPGNMDGSTNQWQPYSTLPLGNPVNQHDRATSEAPRRPYNPGQRRGRRQNSRGSNRGSNRGMPPPKRLDNMNDGRPEAKESSELSVRLDCKICMTQLIDTVVFPCGHAALCRWCADLHIPPDRLDSRKPANCPVCRGPVEKKV